MDKILDSLNPSQREAATHIDGALLILAGAGSGKTKTLTTRLAYLIDVVGIDPLSTLTLTFTNKAANEMRTRALSMLKNQNLPLPLLCTFHKFGLMFLKLYIHHLGRKPNFVLIDTDDQKRIVKKLDSALLANYTPANILGFISSCKNKMIFADQAQKEAKTPLFKDLSKAYAAYEAFLIEKNMLDFDDLLLLSYRVLEEHRDIALEVSSKYQYIMVDEYQDTNFLQVELLKKLCTTHENLCVVGDDDQSIYGWRGADIGYILGFDKTFERAKVIKLQENYRSKEPILRAANKLIAHNNKRLGKELKSTRGEGDEVEMISSADEVCEANTIAAMIKALIAKGVKPQEIAILFRLNALSRSIEEGLNRAQIPYKLIGATRFYERAEIKDVLAYFRLVINIDDDFSLSRIINVPRRGIGKVAQEKIFAPKIGEKGENLSVHEAFSRGYFDKLLPSAQKSELGALFDTVKSLQEKLEESAMSFIDAFDEKLALRADSKAMQDDIDKRANIEEFYGYFRDFVKQNPHSSLDDFLNELSLSSSLDDDTQDCITCMSVHSSKGLEFDYVFIVGFEEGFFPLLREEGDMQEERRLGYVAFTRAKEKLFVSHARSRFYKGNRETLGLSRFAREAEILPSISDEDEINEAPNSGSSSGAIRKGDAVMHKIFGAGVVLEAQQNKLKINFGGNVRVILSDFVRKL